MLSNDTWQEIFVSIPKKYQTPRISKVTGTSPCTGRRTKDVTQVLWMDSSHTWTVYFHSLQMRHPRTGEKLENQIYRMAQDLLVQYTSSLWEWSSADNSMGLFLTHHEKMDLNCYLTFVLHLSLLVLFISFQVAATWPFILALLPKVCASGLKSLLPPPIKTT